MTLFFNGLVHDLHVMAYAVVGGIADDSHALIGAAAHRLLRMGARLARSPGGAPELRLFNISESSITAVEIGGYAISLGIVTRARGKPQARSVGGSERAIDLRVNTDSDRHPTVPGGSPCAAVG